MEYEDLKRELSSYRWALDRQKDLYAERKKWESIATHVTPNVTGMPSGGSGAGTGRVESAAEKIMELTDQLSAQILECIAQRQRVAELIDKADKPQHRSILYKFYIDCYTWRQISDITGYDPDYARQLKRQALRRLCKLLE